MAEDPITIVGVEASSFHRLKVAQVQHVPGKGLIRITGPNKAGKTTLLRAIMAALGGAGEVRPDPVSDESEDGTGLTSVELSNGFTVTRRFTEANPKGYLTIVGPDGGRHNQGKLSDWLGPFSFAPLALFDLAPKRLTEVLLSCGTDPDLGKKLEHLRSSRKRIYDARTPFIAEERRLKKIPQPEGERPEPVDTSAEMTRLGELQHLERERGDLERSVVQFEGELGRIGNQIKVQDALIAKLTSDLAEAKALRHEQELDRTKAKTGRDVSANALEDYEDPAPEMAEVRKRIESAAAVAEAITPWIQYDEAQASLESTAKAVREHTELIKANDADETALLEAAGIPVAGLTFAEDGSPVLNGHPLEVASGRERIEMAVAVAFASSPNLRICLVDEANDIDPEGLEALDAEAKARGFQIWACRIGLEGPGEIVVENGEARSKGLELVEAE